VENTLYSSDIDRYNYCISRNTHIVAQPTLTISGFP